MAVLKIIQNTFGQTKFRYAIPEHSSDLVLSLKDGYLISFSGKKDRNGQTRRAGADDGYPHAVGLCRPFYHFGTVGAGNIVFNSRKMYRSPLFPENAVSLALILMVAHQTAYSCQGIVLKKHPSCFVQLSVQ